MQTKQIEDHLGKLQQQLAALPDAKQPPPTTLQVLGRESIEQDWQRLFIHFLNPGGTHGLGHDLLEHLLTALADRDDIGLSFSRLDLDTIKIAQEVSTSSGRPDAVVWSSEDWFICFELKVGASEGVDQTERYASVETFEGIDLKTSAVPVDGRHYIYLAPETADSPTDEAFVHVTWEWVARQFQSFLVDSYGEYPTRTTAQLDDFIDTIRSELTMTEHQKNQREKMGLYIRYRRSIKEVETAFEKEWTQFAQDWGDRLADAIDIGQKVSKASVPDEYTVFELEGDDDRWIFKQSEDDWAWIFKDGWWRNAETGDTAYTYDPARPDALVGFLHRLDKHRDDALMEKELKFFFQIAQYNTEDFFDSFTNNFNDGPGQERILKTKPDQMELTGKTTTLLEGTYEIQTFEGEDFLDAYINALAEAFLDNVVHHKELIAAIDDCYDMTR